MGKRQINWAIMACVFLLSTLVVAQQYKKPLTNGDIIKMVKCGLPEDTIVLVIENSSNRFDTSPDALIALKDAGTTKRVLDTLRQFQDSPTGPSRVESSPNPRELNLGSYTTKATQTYEYLDLKTTSEVEIKIKIDSVDRDGNVTGEFIHSTLGKGGKGGLIGKMGDSKRLQLKGSLISRFGDRWKVTLTVLVGDRKLTAGQYRLEASSSSMSGHFDIAELEDEN